MRTTLFAVAALAVFTTSTRAHALGGTGLGIGFSEPMVAGFLGLPPAALTFTSLGLSSGLVASLAAGKRPSVGLAIASMILSSASLAWNAAVLSQLTETPWSQSTWAPLLLIAGITVNAATIVFDVVTLVLRKEPTVVVAPIVLPSGAGASLSMRW